MFGLNQDESHKNAIPDMQAYFYQFQFKPIYRQVTLKPLIIISKKNILDMFKIDLLNHRKARLALQYHLHGFTPSEIDQMWYMDFENKLLDLSDLLKEKQEAEKKSYDDQKQSMPDYGKQMKGMKTPSLKLQAFQKFKIYK